MVAVGISKRIKSPRIFSYKKSITERKHTASYGTRTEKQKAERIGSRYYSYDQNGNVIAERDNAPPVDTDIFRPYYQDGDLYWTNYGFGVVHALPRQDDGTYQRVYRWNERNLLTESSDSLYTVHYRYGADGQRALKYVSNTKISTLYFNKMWQITDSRAEWLQSKHIYVGESRIATKYNSEGTANTDAESTRTYYYHSDHLGSAQTVTNHAGAVHERLEYTPYGELWIDWRSDTAPEDATPFRFTGQILDPETGLYYYGARYLDPKTSRWLGVDPAMGEYVPVAPVSDEARKHNQNLPGLGGVFNYVNLHVYHYAGNNPVMLIDPNGREDVPVLLVGAEGTAAHETAYEYIQRELERRGYQVQTNNSMREVYQGDSFSSSRPDVQGFRNDSSEVYYWEIKQGSKNGLREAIIDVGGYIDTAIASGINASAGEALGLIVDRVPVRGMNNVFIRIYSPAPGVIIYDAFRSIPDMTPSPTGVNIDMRAAVLLLLALTMTALAISLGFPPPAPAPVF